MEQRGGLYWLKFYKVADAKLSTPTTTYKSSNPSDSNGQRCLGLQIYCAFKGVARVGLSLRLCFGIRK